MSLVELSIAMALLGLVTTAAILFLTTYLQVSKQVTNTYAASDAALPVVNTLDRYFRAWVPQPTGSNVNASAGANSFVFYADWGRPNAPELIDASFTAAVPNAITALGTFTLSVTAPDPGTCPTACTYPDPNNLSQWNTIASIGNVEAPADGVFAFLPIADDCAVTTPWPPPAPSADPSVWPLHSTSAPPVWTTTPSATSWCLNQTPAIDDIWALAVNLTVEPSKSNAVPANREWVTFDPSAEGSTA
jgi:hypothetical protein